MGGVRYVFVCTLWAGLEGSKRLGVVRRIKRSETHGKANLHNANADLGDTVLSISKYCTSVPSGPPNISASLHFSLSPSTQAHRENGKHADL